MRYVFLLLSKSYLSPSQGPCWQIGFRKQSQLTDQERIKVYPPSHFSATVTRPSCIWGPFCSCFCLDSYRLQCPSSPWPSVPDTEDVAPSPNEGFKVTAMSQRSFLGLVNSGSLYLNVTESTNLYAWTLCTACLPLPGVLVTPPLGPQPLIHGWSRWWSLSSHSWSVAEPSSCPCFLVQPTLYRTTLPYATL